MKATVVRIPKLRPEDYNEDNDVARTLAEKTRHFRLYALKIAPEAFASSYESEVERNLAHTLERLKTPQAAHFFAVDSEVIRPWTHRTHDNFFADLFAANFVGSLVLVGPRSGNNFTARRDPLSTVGDEQDSTTEDQVANEPLFYVLNGTFVDPEARRGGIGRALIEAAIAEAQQEAFNRGVGFRCTVWVDSENPGAKMYEKTGFAVSGEETYVQHPRKRMGECKAEERVAIQLELRRPLPNES